MTKINPAALPMPDVSNIFASTATYVVGEMPAAKVPGPADSSRNDHSTTKAPGGTDASRQKDGG